MKIAIRVDSSFEIGSGHVMRCLVLAQYLQKKSCEVCFLSREHDGNLIEYIKSKGFKVFLLPKRKLCAEVNQSSDAVNTGWLGCSQDNDAIECLEVIENFNPNWLIVDHYSIDKKWETILKNEQMKIMVIDDLANREHNCELLLDQNYYNNPYKRYDNLVPNYCTKLLGPQFSLLRDEFFKIDSKKIRNVNNIFKIFIFMGSSDITNQTLKVVKSIVSLIQKGFLLSVDVLVGEINPNSNQIRSYCDKYSEIRFIGGTSEISKMMLEANIAIGAGGSASLERCYLGLPSLVISVAENQVETTNSLNSFGAIYHLGWFQNVNENMISTQIEKFMRAPNLLNSMSQKATSIFKVNGSKSKLGVEYIYDLLLNKIDIDKE